MILLVVVKPSQFHLLNIFSDNSLVITDGLNPDQLKFALNLFLYLSSNMVSSFFCCIGPIKYCHLVLFPVDEGDEVSEAVICALLPNLIALFILVVEELTSEWNVIVCIFSSIPIIYLRR